MKENPFKIACKIIHFNDQNGGLFLSFLRELESLQKVKSKNIIKLIGYTIDKDFYLFTEYMKRGSLKDFLKADDSKMYQLKFKILIGIVNGMYPIHQKNVVHRDISPDNILITDDYSAKISDFGNAKVMDKNYSIQSKYQQPGCIYYMPKEYHNPKKYYKTTNPTIEQRKKLDVFCFGLTLIELFDGKFENYVGEWEILTKPSLFYDFILKCLDDNIASRYTSIEIKDVFRKMVSNIEKIISKNNLTNNEQIFQTANYLNQEWYKLYFIPFSMI